MTPDEGPMGVNEVFQRQAAVDEGLDRLRTVAIHIALNARRVIGHLIHHFSIGVIKIKVILEKIAMGIHVRHHQLLVNEMVAPEQIGVTRIVVNDHFVDLGKPIGIAFMDLLEIHSEGPVSVAQREAPVSRDFIHLRVIEDLEDHRKEIQSKRAGLVLDLVFHLF